MIKNIFFGICFLSIPSLMFGQETESPLWYNSAQLELHEKEKQFEARDDRGGGSLELPFFDDFSRFSIQTDNPDIPVDWQRWEDRDVFINGTLPIEPPTIGVATLDGLNEDGYPYDFNSDGDIHFPCDTLTSLEINLNGFTQDDDLHLMFFYQSTGLGNSPDLQDSLILEFKAGDDLWVRRWSAPGQGLNDFTQVFIEVWDPDFGNFFLQDGFQFRFRNISEGTGNLDHWHIDYVLLDEDIDPETYTVQDLAIMYPMNSILNNSWTAMPWKHFLNNPEGYMFPDSITLFERNLNSIDYNFRSGFNVRYTDDDTDYFLDIPNPFVNTSGNANSIIETAVPINVNPNNYVFPETVNDTCAEFQVSFYHETVPSGAISNDTTTFTQRFTNYYSYDDGSAERGWFINAAGAKVAVKYQSVIPDTLLGLLIHFTPMRENNEEEIFILRAWGEDGGLPGEELAENFTQYTPNYYSSGYNQFTYYEYDDPIPVDGNFYCGFAQSTDAKMNVGNDKNTNTNTFSLFFTEGPFSPWNASGVEGSLMIRPILKSGKESDIVGIEEVEELSWNVYPNPSKDIVYIDTPLDAFGWTLMDISGRIVRQNTNVNFNSSIDISSLEQGTYLLSLITENGEFIGQKKIIKEN